MLLPAQLPLFLRCFNKRRSRIFNTGAWRVCNRSVADRIGRLDSRAKSFVAHPGLHFFKRAFHVAYGGHAAIPADGDGRWEAVQHYASLLRDLRLISRSMAWRIISRRGSSFAKTASMRAVVPAASGSRNCSAHSFFRPTYFPFYVYTLLHIAWTRYIFNRVEQGMDYMNTETKTLKSGTRIEVRVGGFGFAENWLPAKIVVQRKSKYRPNHPAGYHVVKYSDGTSMAVHRDGFRVIGKAA